MEEATRRSHASGKSSRLQNLIIMFSHRWAAPLGNIQRSAHRLSQFPHTRLAALPWSLKSFADSNNVAVGSTHVSGGNQERVLHVRNVVLTRDTEKNLKSFQKMCSRNNRLNLFCGEAHLRTHQTRTVTWGFGATFVGIDPFEANWVSSPFVSLMHLTFPHVLYFLWTNNCNHHSGRVSDSSEIIGAECLRSTILSACSHQNKSLFLLFRKHLETCS